MTRASTTRSTLAAVALLAALPAALAAQRTASAATVPVANAPVAAVPVANAPGVNAPAVNSSAATAPPAAARVAADSAPRAASRTGPRVPESSGGTLTIDRESFSYLADGRRDPFRSLMVSGDLRPLISELRLTTVIHVATGGSVAVLRDINTNEQHRVRVGQQLGRMRVSAIHPKQVVFTIEEFGFSRQESLALGDSTTPRTQQ